MWGNRRLLVGSMMYWYNECKFRLWGGFMETKEILGRLRKERGWSQDVLAGKLFVTRQAVSRWETGVSHS